MFPLTVAIIARNEADRIVAAIRSVSFASDILVLDSGSTDETVALATEAGARVIETDWPGHVAQKNRAIAAAHHDWILSIDADERLSEELALSIQGLDPEKGGLGGYRFPRLSWWMGKPIRHGTWYPDCRIRLFDRRRGRWAGQDPHDTVEMNGPVGRIEGVLYHHPYRNMGEHLRTIDRYTRISADGAIRAGQRAHWWDPVLRPYLHFVKALLLKRGILDGVRGWCLALLGATYVALKWTRIYLGEEASSAERDE